MDLNKMRSSDSTFAKLSVIFSKSESLHDPFTMQSTLTEGVLGGCEGWGLQKLRREGHPDGTPFQVLISQALQT